MTLPVQAQIPPETDWVEYGLVLDVGPFGQAWDALMEGSTPASILKRNELYYLYYVGSDNYIAQKTNIGPAHRAIGVATSRDGIRWSKYAGNPILTFTSSGNPEEGVPAAGMFVDPAGTLIAYYGANLASDATAAKVSADVRIATSSDGLNFTGTDIVLNHAHPHIWGAWDELHAVAGLFQNGTYYAYYVPNGTLQRGKLGVAWGAAVDQLTRSRAVVSRGLTVPARGPLSIVQLDANTLAFFNTVGSELHVRLGSIDDPTRLGPVVARYTNLDGFGKTVFLEKARKTWFMYTNYWSYIGLRLAPFGEADKTPPTAPSEVHGTASHETIALGWSKAVDTDTGIIQYRIYHNGVLVGETFNLTYTVTSLAEQTTYTFDIRAVNLHGIEGPGSTVTVTTGSDDMGPAIEHIRSGGDSRRVDLTFDQPIEKTSAENTLHYTIAPEISVLTAALQSDHKTVSLTVSPQLANTLYTVSAANIVDQAVGENGSHLQTTYTYAPVSGLVAYWRLDSMAATKVLDSSGSSHHGYAFNTPAVVEGRVANAFAFNGISHYVEIDNTASLDTTFMGPFTVGAWVYPIEVPPNTTNSNTAYTIFRGPNMVIRYRADQRFEALVQTVSGPVSLTSGRVPPGQWHHIVAVVRLPPEELHLHLDSRPVNGSPVSLHAPLAPIKLDQTRTQAHYFAKYRIGVNSPIYDEQRNFFRGFIDDVQVYDRALSTHEMNLLNMR